MKKLLNVLNGRTEAPPPVWLMRQAGRYLPEYKAVRAKAGSFLDLCYNPDLAAEVTLQPIRRFDFDAAIIFADILLVPFALGQELKFVEGEGPKLMPLSAIDDVFRAVRTDRLAPVYASLRKVRTALPDNKGLIGFCGAPWTVACYMIEGGSSMDFAAARKFASEQRAEFLRLLKHLSEVSADYLCGQIEAGADTLQIFDSWAGLVDAEDFTDFIVTPMQNIVRKVKEKYPTVPIIGFPRGAGENYRIYARATGIDGISLDQTIPIDFAVDLQKTIPVQGNLAPETLVQGGAILHKSVQAILKKLGHAPFIFNLGHGILSHTPPEHVAELVRVVRREE